MNSTKALLQLRDYWFEDFRWKPVGKSENPVEEDILPGVKVGVFQADEGGDYFVQLQVFLSEDRAQRSGAPYQFRLIVVGQFYFEEGLSPEVQKHMIYANGASILYGIARASLAEGTAHGREGKYVLPSLNFIKILEKSGQLRGAVRPALT